MRKIPTLVAVVVFAIAITTPARATRRDPVLTQAQSCVGEVGWHDIPSCVAMTYVHIARAEARGMRLDTMARLYSAALRRPTRPWILRLDRRGREPRGWRRASWSAHRDRWLSVVDAVERTVQGGEANPCPGALHYGSTRLDHGRLDPEVWEEIDCLPKSGQTFYRLRE